MSESRLAHQTGTGSGDERAELLAIIMTAETDAEALIALSLLRSEVPDEQVLNLLNLRELVRSLPAAAMVLPLNLEVLAGDAYEYTGHSMRRAFEGAAGPFGLEFVGQSNVCDRIVLHTAGGLYEITGGQHADPCAHVLRFIVADDRLYDALAEAIASLGLTTPPERISQVDAFAKSHAAAAATEALHELF